VEGAEPSSPSAEGEMLSAFLFDNFFFAPVVSKKKWAGSLISLGGQREPSPAGEDCKQRRVTIPQALARQLPLHKGAYHILRVPPDLTFKF